MSYRTSLTQPTQADPEVLRCPYCGLEIKSWFTPPEQRGNETVTRHELSHRLPACQEFRKNADPDVFLDRARLEKADPRPQ